MRTQTTTALTMPEGWPKFEVEGDTCTQTHIYEHQWELVAAAYDLRYPSHPLVPELVSTTVTNHHDDPTRGRTEYDRKIVLQANEMPWIVRKVTGTEQMEVATQVTLDLFERKLTTKSRNLTWRDSLHCDEECQYWASKERPGWTEFRQVAVISIAPAWQGYYGMGTVHGFLMDSYSKAVGKGRVIDWLALVEC